MHHQQRHISCSSQHAQLNWNPRRTRAHTTPTRHNPTHTDTHHNGRAGAVADAGVGTVGAGCITNHDSIIISDLHITHNGHPRQKQWARKASAATTASTHTDVDDHHIGTTGAVGGKCIDNIRSSQTSRPTQQPPQCTRVRQKPAASPAATSARRNHHEQCAQTRTLTGAGADAGAGAGATVCITNHDTSST